METQPSWILLHLCKEIYLLEMNVRSKILTTFLFLQVFISCNKDSLPDGRFIGTWVSEEKTDTMIFIDDHTFKKPFYDRLLHTFEYNYTEDSITIQYTGPNFVLTRPSTHHYTLTHSTLIIDLYKVNSGLELVEMEYLKSEK